MDTGKIVIDLIGFAYSALVIQSLAYKTGTPKGWMAWIPLANFYLLVKIAKKPTSWFWWMIAPLILLIVSMPFNIIFAFITPLRIFFAVLALIGIVGTIGTTVISLILLASIIKILGKPAWTIILAFIPLVNFVFISYLAFAPSVVVSNLDNQSGNQAEQKLEEPPHHKGKLWD